MMFKKKVDVRYSNDIQQKLKVSLSLFNEIFFFFRNSDIYRLRRPLKVDGKSKFFLLALLPMNQKKKLI